MEEATESAEGEAPLDLGLSKKKKKKKTKVHGCTDLLSAQLLLSSRNASFNFKSCQ